MCVPCLCGDSPLFATARPLFAAARFLFAAARPLADVAHAERRDAWHDCGGAWSAPDHGGRGAVVDTQPWRLRADRRPLRGCPRVVASDPKPARRAVARPSPGILAA